MLCICCKCGSNLQRIRSGYGSLFSSFNGFRNDIARPFFQRSRRLARVCTSRELSPLAPDRFLLCTSCVTEDWLLLLWRLDRETVAATAAAAAVAADRRAVVVPDTPVLHPRPVDPEELVFVPLAEDIDDGWFDDEGGEGAFADDPPGPDAPDRLG